jgi:hypothetical protein
MNRHRNWSEFDWERELRKDEERIHSYFGELKTYLDLPGEEEIIMKKLMSKPNLVPSNLENGEMMFDSFYEDNSDFFISTEWRRKEGGDIFTQLEKLAQQWTLIFASGLRDTNLREGIYILCLFGKLLARNVDFIGVAAHDNIVMLKLSLCKRLHHDINKLLGEFRNLKLSQKSLQIKIDGLVSNLQNIRERVVDLLGSIKDSANDEGDEDNDL